MTAAVTAAEMAAADRVAIHEIGIAEAALMENAAARVADAARELLGSVRGKRVVALCGSGNNGGDALAALRHLQAAGAQVRAILASGRAELRPLAARQADTLERCGAPVAVSAGATDFSGAALLLDGLLGYSGRGAPRGEMGALIAAANGSGVPILAIDLPSGVDADTGFAAGMAIRAALTVTLAMPKRGLLEPVARPYVGRLLVADIGIPARAYTRLDCDPARIFGAGPLVRVPLESDAR